MRDSFDVIKKIGYVLVIMLVFSPLTFLIATTITGPSEHNTCWERYPAKPIDSENYDQQQLELEQCNAVYEENQKGYQTTQFIIVSIISIIAIITLLVLYKKIQPIIAYSLFFGASLNTIIIVWRFVNINSLVASLLGAALFVLLVVFINKNLKKK